MTQAEAVSTLTDAQMEYSVIERQLAKEELSLKPLRTRLNELRNQVIAESNIRVTNEPVYPYGISHTRRPELGETKGTLSEKAAKDAGYEPIINKGEQEALEQSATKSRR
jgi:hypothetical protein